jgi:hypothetical protein
MTLATKKFLTIAELEALRAAVLAKHIIAEPKQEPLPAQQTYPTLRLIVDNMRKHGN